MAKDSRWIEGITSTGFSWSVRAWMGTLDYRAVLETPEADPARGLAPPTIYVLWHEYMLCPIYLRSHCHVAALLSQHRDVE